MHKKVRKALFGTVGALALTAGILGSGISAKAADLEINKTNFPDSQFRAYIEEIIDKDENQILSDAEIAAVEYMDLSGITIKDLTGLKYFTNLKNLTTDSKRLKTADFSGMKSLEYLKVDDATLVDMDVTDCENLQDISACGWAGDGYGTLKEIRGLQSCEKLEALNVCWQEFETLDVSGCKSLKWLYCDENKITSLNVSDCVNLSFIDCQANGITSLDVSGCNSLETLKCDENKLSSLDVSGLEKLEDLTCEDNKLSELKVSGCNELFSLSCSNNEMRTLDVSNLERLEYLSCTNNKLSELNVTGCKALYRLECYDNKLSELNVSGLEKLCILKCNSNNLSELNVSGCKEMGDLACQDNAITSLNVSDASELWCLNCSNNKLTKLDISDASELWDFHCSNNELTKLDISKCASLTFLDCTYNQLAFVDLENNTDLYKTAKIDKQNPYQVSLQGSIKIPGLDVSRISELTGASIQDGKLVPHSGVSEITYIYDNKNSKVKNVKYTLVSKEHEHIYAEEWKTTKNLHYKVCTVCGHKDQIGTHELVDVVKPANVSKKNGKYTSKEGRIDHQCSVCEKVVSKEVIPEVYVIGTKFKFSKVRYTGKRRNPEYWVRYGGTKYENISPEFYTVKKAKGRLDVGKYTYTITFKGNYKGSMKISYKIVPDNTQITKLKAAEGGFEVSWEEQPTETTGYRIEYRKGREKWKMKDIDDNTVTKNKITGLQRGKQYQVRLRTYKKNGDQIYTSNVSQVRTVVTK